MQSSSKPGVSVVIPAYNYAHYLPVAINSVLQQDYPEYEIIVVDDGSTDNTRDVVAQFGDKVRYIHQKNAGLSAARNTGIKAARFDYVGFLDADDQWLPAMLSTTMSNFSQLPKEFGLIGCGSVDVGPDGQPLGFKRLAQKPQELSCRDIIFNTRFMPSTAVAKKEVFAHCGYFDETLRSSEDRDMWIRVAAKYRVHLLGERLVLIRKHTSNMSKHADRMRSNVRKVIGKAYEQRLVPRSAIFFWLRTLSFHHFQNAWRYRDERRYREALGQLVVSVGLWPFFSQPRTVNELFLFRSRALARFILEAAGLKKR